MNIKDQLKWERECIERGSQRYYFNQDRMRDSGQADQTDVVSYLVQQRLRLVADKVKNLSDIHTGLGGKYNHKLKSLTVTEDFLKIAYISVKAVFQNIMIPRDCTALRMSLEISSRLEADLKCQMFEATYPEYYSVVMESFDRQKVNDYVHQHKVLMKKFNDFELTWNEWTSEFKVQMGSRILRCILESFDDVIYMKKLWHRNKTKYIIETTVNFDDWAAKFEREKGLLLPYLLPLKIPPRDWDGIRNGGYYLPQISKNVRFIKTKGNDHAEFVKGKDISKHLTAVNKLQKTAWVINKEVLDVQRIIYNQGLQIGIPSNEPIPVPEFPEHLREIPKDELTEPQKVEVGAWKECAKRSYAKEQERKGKVISFMQAFKLAEEVKDWEELYYVYTCDFRGRIYCATTGLSPQGADTAKGLLKFKREVRLGEDGVKWLAIHGANVYGEDKLPYHDRVQWIKEREDMIQSIVENPIGYRKYWGNADKPYQFLAFCFEWAKCDYGRNIEATSQIPIGLDGSCNGLQHFSAMLRDSVGAKATNLTATTQPQDIYQEVADECTRLLKELDDPRAKKWLQVGVNRKCAKRPVMTLPYGATQQSAKDYIMEYVQANWSKFNLDEKHQWEFARFLTPILWKAIGKVVVAAREAMSWLQRNSGKEYACWITPIGFPVYQFYKNTDRIVVSTQLNGSVRLFMQNINGKGIPHRGNQRNGIAPNFVHSIDSTHMVMTILETDFTDYAMIHDDYGTHAGNTEKLFTVIRKTFFELYSNHDPLAEWADQLGIDKSSIPRQGDYNIEDIKNADYFFG